MKSSLYRWGLVVVAFLVALYALTPTILDWSDGALDGKPASTDGVASMFLEVDPTTEQITWTNVQPLTLGLDLQGGLLLQYHVYVDRAVQDQLTRMAGGIEERLREVQPDVQVEATHPDGETYIDVTLGQADDRKLFTEEFMSNFPSLTRSDTGSTTLRLQMDPNYIEETKEMAITQAIEKIRLRIDALGVAEPSVTRQGLSDIVIQLPGIREENIERAKDLIGQTAQLRFQMVDDSGTNQFFGQFRGQLPAGFALRSIDGGYFSVTHQDKEALQEFFAGRVADDRAIGYQFHPVYQDREKKVLDEEQSYWKTYLVYREAELTGEYIQDARVAVDQQFNRPYVSLTFFPEGAKIFAETTTEYTGQRFAIMMDDEVNSAPVINEPITGGRAQITLGSMQSYTEVQQEAQNLVIVLRHGALPAPIERQFETIVGPTLGQDSIDSSMRALLVGSILVILFMLIYYRRSGVISTIALTLNLVLIMAGLASLGATLTLPGIAGIILTVGMAVDANVIIYERIREELVVNQKPVRVAVKEGFDKAFSAVLDANITTGIAALVLLQYGTGPIRGFAITLLIGIVSTLFTAVYVTRILFDDWMQRTKSEKLSI
ncbi:protein translocase subunit SecD [Lujinxingia litoralis]|nr:protein translocase subunit SecD [Lujinxingia litoralis]